MDRKKISCKKAVFIIILIGVLLIIMVWMATPRNEAFKEYHIDSAQSVADFLADLGWEPDTQNITVQESMLPDQFDDTFTEYNALQLKQGCDLTKFTGEAITIYTVPILNYSNSAGNVYATVIVHTHRVIGGDIHSAELNGFMHTLR